MKKMGKRTFEWGRGAGIGVTFVALAVIAVTAFQNGSMMNLHGTPVYGEDQRLSQIIPYAGDEEKPIVLGRYANRCDANNEWIGHEVDEGAVKAVGNPYRILPPGSMVTMDHNPMRINVHLDDNDIVIDVRCG